MVCSLQPVRSGGLPRRVRVWDSSVARDFAWGWMSAHPLGQKLHFLGVGFGRLEVRAELATRGTSSLASAADATWHPRPARARPGTGLIHLHHGHTWLGVPQRSIPRSGQADGEGVDRSPQSARSCICSAAGEPAPAPAPRCSRKPEGSAWQEQRQEATVGREGTGAAPGQGGGRVGRAGVAWREERWWRSGKGCSSRRVGASEVAGKHQACPGLGALGGLAARRARGHEPRRRPGVPELHVITPHSEPASLDEHEGQEREERA